MTRGIEARILPTCRALGIGITAYGVLSRGLISGHWSKERSTEAGFRAVGPRFLGANLDHNLRLVDKLGQVAAATGATVAQIAIAWVLSRGDDIVPLVGARRRDQLAELLASVDLTLSAGDLAAIERAMPPDAAAGQRYAAPQMAHLDSERS